MSTAYFIRKPLNRADLLNRAEAADQGYEAEAYTITETIGLTIAEYDAFAATLSRPRPWLFGKGGLKNGKLQVIEVRAERRPTLLVNPEGSDYARYVAYR